MNKEKNQNGKYSIQSRGRWSIRLNNELLDLVQKGIDSWESIARNLGFSVNECQQQYDYLLHPEKYEKQTSIFTMQKKVNKKDEGKEKKKRRAVSKAATRVAPGVSVNPCHPPAYATWEEPRKELWDQIPFNANEYYLHYLPPGISPRPIEWSDSEIAEFKTLITIYPPNDKWGLFSLHLLGRTGAECESQFKKLQTVTMVDPCTNEKEHHCVVKYNIVFSESESDATSLPPVEPSLSPPSIQILSPLSVGDAPSLPLDEDVGETTIPDVISNPGVEPLYSPSSPMNQLSTLPGIYASSSPMTSSHSAVNHSSPPVNHSSHSPVTHSSPPPVANSLPSLMTPPRQSVKRQVISNDSPPVTPSKIVSVPQPALVTPIKSSVQSKSVEISPTKVFNEVEIPVVKNRAIVLTTQLKRLRNEQEQERNRFRQQMKLQTTEMVNAFEIGLSKWNGVKEFAAIQREYQHRYNTMCRVLQLQYNTLVARQIKHLQYYGLSVNEEELYALHFPKITFAMRLFKCFVC